jgi:hypothetical protein
MRRMRACATANAVFLGLVAAALGFAACSTGQSSSQPPAAPDGPASTSTTVALAIEAPRAKPVPKTVADCKELVSDIVNDPPSGGVPLNNAMTAKDAGATDRLEPITELIKSKRDGFRCCFDLWARKTPGAGGAMKMVLKLKPDGSLVNVSFADTSSRVDAPEVEGCMSDLARGLAYPKSPSGKETTFTYPFDFKPRR